MTINRRQFLHDTAAAGAALTAVSASAVKAANSANNKLTVGVMGVNGRGSALTRGFAQQEGCQVAYICDVDQRAVDKAKKIVTQLGLAEPKGVTDFRNVLDDKSVDILVCARPTIGTRPPPSWDARPANTCMSKSRAVTIRTKAKWPWRPAQEQTRRADGQSAP